MYASDRLIYQVLLPAFVAQGLDRARLLTDAALTEPDGGLRPESPLSFHDCTALLESVKRRSGDPLTAFRSLWESPPLHSALAVLVHAEPTIADGLQQLRSFMHLVVRHSSFHVRIGPLTTEVSMHYAEPPVSGGERQAMIAGLAGLLRDASGDRISFRRLGFADPPPARARAYGDVVGFPVLFGTDSDFIEFPSGALSLQPPRANPIVAEAVRGALGRASDGLRSDDHPSLASRVEAVVMEALGRHQMAQVGDVAAHLGMSRRGLQRRLAEEETSFRQVRSRIYEREAKQMLAERDLRVHEIADRLGFALPSSFIAAFRRWTGEAPGAYRRRIQTDAPDGAER